MGDAVYCRHGRDVACYGCWECDRDERAAMMYPEDGGLPKQKRPYDKTKGVAALLRKTFFANEK